MTPLTKDHEEIKLYLLGNLSEEIRERVEARLLTEKSFLDELLIVEEELIDDYVTSDLSDGDRLRFEQHFLCTPERQQKLRFALALTRYASTLPEPVESHPAPEHPADGPTWASRLRAFWSSQPRALRAAAALALVVVVAGALWLYRPRTQPVQTFATLTLTVSANNRADALQASGVKLSPDDTALRVYLTLPEPSSPTARYRAELDNDAGETKPFEAAGHDARTVSLVIPSTQLARGRYALRLFTSDAGKAERRINGSYFFTVE